MEDGAWSDRMPEPDEHSTVAGPSGHAVQLPSHLISLAVASWQDLDFNGGTRVHEYFTPDGVYDFAGEKTVGRDAIRARFDARRLAGQRSTLHMVSNFRCAHVNEGSAELTYYICVFGADGTAVQRVGLPTLLGTLTDVYDRRPGDQWLLSLRRFRPVFFDPDDRVGRKVSGFVG